MKTTIKKLPFYKKAADLFEIYKEQDMAVFLDSSLENKLGNYSVIGINPYLVLKEENGILYKNQVPCNGRLEEEMKRYLQENYEENFMALPLLAGAIGYFSYDYGRKF